MAFYGKEFKLDSQENFDKFVESFGDRVPESSKQAMINHKGTLKLTKNGDKYTLVVSQPGGVMRETTFTSGVGSDEEIQGHKCRNTYTMNGNVLTQEVKFVEGTAFTIKREFSDNQVVATIKSTSCDVIAKRIYK